MATNQDVALSESAEFVNYPFGNRFRYGPVLDSLEIERVQFSPDSQAGLFGQYSFKNTAGRKRQLRLHFSVRTDLRPVWFSDRLGIEDAQDTVAWQPTDSLFIAQDRKNPWFCVWGATPPAGAQPIANPPPVPTSDMGVTATSRHALSVGPHSTSTLTFVISGSAPDKNAALHTYNYLTENPATPLATKK